MRCELPKAPHHPYSSHPIHPYFFFKQSPVTERHLSYAQSSCNSTYYKLSSEFHRWAANKELFTGSQEICRHQKILLLFRSLPTEIRFIFWTQNRVEGSYLSCILVSLASVLMQNHMWWA